jgi:hypothetical protein
MTRLIRLVLIIVIASAGFIGYRWYQYVSNTNSPYDEVGITLNSYMPEPINKWGCDRLKQTFGSGLPPAGCASGDGKQWK